MVSAGWRLWKRGKRIRQCQRRVIRGWAGAEPFSSVMIWRTACDAVVRFSGNDSHAFNSLLTEQSRMLGGVEGEGWKAGPK